MKYKKIYKDYCEKLLTLPLDDCTFIAKLTANDLLPGDTSSRIEGQSTRAEKALCFLNSVIKPSIDTDYEDIFNKLLSVMKQSDFDHVKKLALDIASAMIDGEEKTTCDQPDSTAPHAAEASSRNPRKLDNVVKCPRCKELASLRQVTDSRKNTYEHEYYYCATDDIFIEWKNTANVKCECNEMAKKDITKKKGPNRGRWFYNCKIEECKFFIWSDKVEPVPHKKKRTYKRKRGNTKYVKNKRRRKKNKRRRN